MADSVKRDELLARLVREDERDTTADTLRTFYVNRDDGYAWLYHCPHPDDEIGHSVGIEIEGGTTLADLYTAATNHTCKEN